jgi:hypothetical protein
VELQGLRLGKACAAGDDGVDVEGERMSHRAGMIRRSAAAAVRRRPSRRGSTRFEK